MGLWNELPPSHSYDTARRWTDTENEWKDNGTEFFSLYGLSPKYFVGNIWMNWKSLEYRSAWVSWNSRKYRNHYEFKELIDSCYDTEWVPYCKKTFNGAQSVIDYLGKYTHRIAISNHRIIHMDDENVTFLLRITGKKDNGRNWPFPALNLYGVFWCMCPPDVLSGSGIMDFYVPAANTKTHFMPESSRMQKYLSKLRDKEMPEILKQLYRINICVCKSCGGHLGNHNWEYRKGVKIQIFYMFLSLKILRFYCCIYLSEILDFCSVCIGNPV